MQTLSLFDHRSHIISFISFAVLWATVLVLLTLILFAFWNSNVYVCLFSYFLLSLNVYVYNFEINKSKNASVLTIRLSTYHQLPLVLSCTYNPRSDSYGLSPLFWYRPPPWRHPPWREWLWIVDNTAPRPVSSRKNQYHPVISRGFLTLSPKCLLRSPHPSAP